MPIHEREGIKHHLMDFLETEEEYKVTNFLKDASQKVYILQQITCFDKILTLFH